jgi:hypothetical protein
MALLLINDIQHEYTMKKNDRETTGTFMKKRPFGQVLNIFFMLK